MKNTKSKRLFEVAKRHIPGGVNSPVRAFKSVGSVPLFIQKAKGAYVWDADGNKFIDYVGSWGPMLFGHSHPRIVKAIKRAATWGTSYGAPTELEIKMAERIKKLVPSIDIVRMVNSGTEATMSAIRLARAYTSRDKIIKFEGCYHGHGDAFLIRAGSGALTLGIPDSPGVPSGVAADTLAATFNDIESVRVLAREYRDQIAAIIVEPVVGNMGCIPPRGGFLSDLRRLCDESKIVLIFDEVMTGFRLAAGGAQELYGVRPDLTTLGKIIGGGLPVGAYGGKSELMSMVAPAGPMYQAGTLSGNPLAMAAGYEMLRMISEYRPLYRVLEKQGSILEEETLALAKLRGYPVSFNRVGSMFTLFFTPTLVTDYATAKSSDTSRFAAYFRAMLEEGIYLAPSQFEAAFLSTSHSEKLTEKTLKASGRALERAFS